MVWPTDWEVTQSDAALIVTQQISGPITGSGSLRLDSGEVSEPADPLAMFMRHTTTRGFVRGKARCRTHGRWDFGGESSQYVLCGLACMQSQADLFAAGGAGYLFALRKQHTASGRESFYQLFKVTNGVLTLLATTIGGPSTTSISGLTFALELEWHYDAAVFGGTALIGRAVAGDDAAAYANLTDVVTFTDTNSPHSTSAGGEGLCWSHHEFFAAGYPGQIDLFDDFEIYEIT